MKPLSVYKASAGSGKTYTLALEYIKLLIRDPYCFKKILAVTFTNKATEEMKNRILSQLYGISKGLEDSDSYLLDVTQALGISKEQCKESAKKALNCLLHNYNHFRVETIDSFFQSIMRNLAKELDLTANLKIDLNDEQVKDQAVDLLIEQLDSKNILLQWIISYIISNIEENKSWNVIGQIKDFGKTIFKDYYKDVSKDLAKVVEKEGFFEKLIQELRTLRDDSDNRMKGYAQAFEDILSSHGLTVDLLSGKSRGIASYFKKLKNLTYSDKNCLNDTFYKHLEADAWAIKSSPYRQEIISLAEDQLVDFLKRVEEDRHASWPLRLSAELTLRHISKLRLLNSIEEKVHSLNQEANRFLLSDTQHLLRALIKDSDTPFIYERTGAFLEHIMIDEFQDTSIVQWTNFKVLLDECMSHYEKESSMLGNLIVGDVKQSIYRWRSGDWRLLNNIDDWFPSFDEQLSHHRLKTNFRSSRNIVEFNNLFFSLAAKEEYKSETEVNSEEDSKEILKAYSDIVQEIPKGKDKEGLVRIDLLPSGEEYEKEVLEKTVAFIEELLHNGVSPNDIAILVRANKNIPKIAEAVTRRRADVKVVSDEAFALKSSLAIRTIIMALKLILDPNDILNKTSLALTYQRIILSRDISENEIHSLTSKKDYSFIESLLPEPFNGDLSLITRKTLLEMIETCYSAFEVSRLKGQGAYICAFFDAARDYSSEYVASLDGFLKAWEDSIQNQNVQADDVDGIRILSIHKSKGLEFKNVIIPFCDWKMDNGKTMLWCKPEASPFNRLPIIPIDYSNKTLESIYAMDYKNEHIQNTVDNLNLLYVAFTRASNNLFVIGKQTGDKGKNVRSKLLNVCLEPLKDGLQGASIDEDEESLTFKYGKLKVQRKAEDKISMNVFTSKSTPSIVDMRPYSSRVEFRQHNQSFDFIHSEEDDSQRRYYISRGSILHNVFSRIKTISDVERVLNEIEFEGVFSNEELSREEVKRIIEKAFTNPVAASWFDPKWTVFNECSISFLDPETNKVLFKRPDRVITSKDKMIVIDFKFGSSHEEYYRQVRQYMSLLNSMGYSSITGYLWYVFKNEIVEVEPLKSEI